MFACAMYPATNEFLLNVVDEVNTQVKRLQHHASLALYAANNENEAALRGNWYQTYERFDIYKNDYIKLYVSTIIRNVTNLDPSRECLSSSPTNGIQSKIEGWIAENPGDSRYGDVHHYDYYGDTWDSKTFKRRTRYASEYGFQSFPYIGSLAKVINYCKELSYHRIGLQNRSLTTSTSGLGTRVWLNTGKDIQKVKMRYVP
jgi:beta-mannosidase